MEHLYIFYMKYHKLIDIMSVKIYPSDLKIIVFFILFMNRIERLEWRSKFE